MAGMEPGTEHPERRDVIVDSTGGGPMRHDREERTTASVIAGGSITEAIAGLTAAALAILGLAGILPGYLAAIATIAIGVALLAQGGAAAANWSKVVTGTPGHEWGARGEVSGGMTGEVLGGAAGLVLGILALIGLAPQILIPAALVAFGGAMLVGTGTTVDLGAARGHAAAAPGERSPREVTMVASGTQMLVGIVAIVLGILALIGVDPLTLSLVGLLAAGASILFSGSAVSARILTLLRR